MPSLAGRDLNYGGLRSVRVAMAGETRRTGAGGVSLGSGMTLLAAILLALLQETPASRTLPWEQIPCRVAETEADGAEFFHYGRHEDDWLDAEARRRAARFDLFEVLELPELTDELLHDPARLFIAVGGFGDAPNPMVLFAFHRTRNGVSLQAYASRGSCTGPSHLRQIDLAGTATVSLGERSILSFRLTGIELYETFPTPSSFEGAVLLVHEDFFASSLSPEPATELEPAAPLSVVTLRSDACTATGALDADGRRHGAWRTSRPDGTPLATAFYWHGARSGPWRSFHPGGALAEVGRLEDDAYSGTWTTFDAEGNRIRERGYVRNRLDGSETEWFPSGARRSSMTWREGEPLGRMRIWNEDGELVTEVRRFF